MPLASITSFGDGSHAPGDTDIDIEGGSFGAFPLGASIFENEDRTGAADALTVNSANDLTINVDIPGSLNNAAGTRYVAVQLENEDWSFSFPFTLEAGASSVGLPERLLRTARYLAANRRRLPQRDIARPLL